MGSTALVLGGGGPVGGGWMTGVLAGLCDAGVDPVRADVVIGTSAGAIFGSRLLAGESARELYERQLVAPTGWTFVSLPPRRSASCGPRWVPATRSVPCDVSDEPR